MYTSPSFEYGVMPEWPGWSTTTRFPQPVEHYHTCKIFSFKHFTYEMKEVCEKGHTFIGIVIGQ